MLSWSAGEVPVAIVRGSRNGKNDGKILYLSDKAKAPPDSFVDVDILDGCLQPYPNPSLRNVTYSAGQAGSGKSTWNSNYMAEWSAQHPKRPLFIVSRVASDATFDDIPGVERIPASRFTGPTPLTIDSFPPNSFVLFDDIDTYPDKKIKEAVQRLRQDILETGRHKMIHCASTNHNLIDGNSTRTLLNETHLITVFPKGGSLNQLRYLLKTYLGYSREEIAHFIKLPSRWVTIYRNYPGCVIHSSGAYTSDGGVNVKKSALL